LDNDDWYGGGDLDERLKRRLDGQEKWCKVMNSMKPTEMVATAMSNINAFLLRADLSNGDDIDIVLRGLSLPLQG
jgi:hypothetical protein